MRIIKASQVSSVVGGLLLTGLVVLVVGCGGSASTTTTSAAPTTTSSAASSTTSAAGSSTTSYSPAPGSTEATITANWDKFFDGSLPVQDKVGLLENGQQYQQQLDAQAAGPLAKVATASVSGITVTSASTATVTYSILVGGQPALPNQTGQAVLQDGVWKVTAQSFLALLALEQGTTPTT